MSSFEKMKYTIFSQFQKSHERINEPKKLFFALNLIDSITGVNNASFNDDAISLMSDISQSTKKRCYMNCNVYYHVLFFYSRILYVIKGVCGVRYQSNPATVRRGRAG